MTAIDRSALLVQLFGTADIPDWRLSALCAQTDPTAFFPDAGGSIIRAKRICQRCEVRAECLKDALEHNEGFGVWGGLSGQERRRLRDVA